MASTHGDADDASEQQQQQLYHNHHHQSPKSRQAPLPKSILSRAWSMNSSSFSDAAGSKCVCAPATHARSFKCRLHRVSSHGHSAPSAAATATQPPA